MEDFVQFCDKTITITTQIITTESLLKTSTNNNNRFEEIKAEIMKNEESSKKILRHRKFKKFNALNKTTVPSHTNSQEDDATQDRPRKLLYSDIIKRKPSELLINKKSKELQVPTKPTDNIQHLGTLNTKKSGKSPMRSKSNTKQSQDKQLKTQIEQLKEELKVLKDNKKTETTKNTDTFTTKLPRKIPKMYKWHPIQEEANKKSWKLFKQ